MVIAFEQVKREYHPIPIGQVLNRLPDRFHIQAWRRFICLLPGFGRYFSVPFFQFFKEQAVALEVVDAVVDRNAFDPCSYRSLEPKGMELGIHIDERILQQVLSVLFIADHAQAHVVHSPGI